MWDGCDRDALKARMYCTIISTVYKKITRCATSRLATSRLATSRLLGSALLRLVLGVVACWGEGRGVYHSRDHTAGWWASTKYHRQISMREEDSGEKL